MSADAASFESRYCRGTISVVHSGSRAGWLPTENGRDFPFAAAHPRLLGAQRFAVLRPGLRVGFDLGRNERGLCVTTIRVYETP